MKWLKSLEHLSLQKILLYGFLILGLASILGAYKIRDLFFKTEYIIKQQKLVLDAYDASFQLKQQTEKLLTSNMPMNDFKLWQATRLDSDHQFKKLATQFKPPDNQVKWQSIWRNIQYENQLIIDKFNSPKLEDIRKIRKPLLSYLGEQFNFISKDDFYVELLALTDEIQFAQQYQVFLIDDLKQLSHQYVIYSNRELNVLHQTMFTVLLGYLAFMFMFSFLLFKLAKNNQEKLMHTQDALTSTLERLQSNQQQLIQSRDSFNQLALHDPLTNLPNRRYLAEFLNDSIHEAKKKHTNIALFFIDLDRFKEINDTLGHSVGDKVLIVITERIKKMMPQTVFFARLGGDEFTVVLNHYQHLDEVSQLAEDIIKNIAKTIHSRKWQLHVTCSIGICCYPDSALNSETLLRNADIAMYVAKNNGKNNFQFYSNSLSQKIDKRASLEQRLRKSIRNNDFIVMYQPQVSLENTQLLGLEALIRWEISPGEFIDPNEFIPIAEETGLIVPISEWVLETVAKQAVAWHSAGLNPGPIAINLSGSLLMHSSFLNSIHHTLNKYECHTDWIELEVTESQLMSFPDDVINLLSELKKMGFRVAIDDFGTGYSSLSALKLLPINKIKIDKSFLNNVPHDKQSSEVIQAIINMASALEMEIVAEGVEYQEQAVFLIKAGCYQAQGFLFNKALPASEIEILLKTSPHTAQGSSRVTLHANT